LRFNRFLSVSARQAAPDSDRQASEQNHYVMMIADSIAKIADHLKTRQMSRVALLLATIELQSLAVK
jgi:hypothetical protein